MTATDTAPKKATVVERTTGDLVKAAASGWLGTALEFMDFQLYSLAAALVFSHLFFPEGDPAVAVIAAMGIYGVGYIARPIGAWYFGRMGDRIGRTKVLFITIAMMGASTTLIGVLPTYHQVGLLAPALLLVLRLVQGFGAGAEIAGTSVMLAEYAPDNRRGIIASLVAIGTNTGTLGAGLIWAILTGVMSEETLMSWGWRIPFLGSVILMGLAVFIRMHLKETPVFEASQEEVLEAYDAPLGDKVKAEEAIEQASPVKHKISVKAWLLAAFLRFGQSGNSGMVQTYLISFLAVNMMLSKSVTSMVVTISSIVGFVTIPLIGALGDKFGRKKMYLAVSGLGILITIPCLMILTGSLGTSMNEAGELDSPTIMFFISYILLHNVTVLSMFSLESITMAEMFGSKRRYEALAMSKEIPNMITAGFGPMIAAALVAAFSGSWVPVGIMMMVFCGSVFITAVIMPEVRGRDLTDPKDAA